MKLTALALAFALSLSACANSALTVEKPYRGSERFSAAQIVSDQSNVSVEEGDIAYTRQKLEEAFFAEKNPLFNHGQGLTVRFRYVAFNEGSRFGRYLTAGLTGGSKIVLETEFVNPTGEILATVRGEGTVSGGLFGGSNKTGIDKAVKKIAEYAAANLR